MAQSELNQNNTEYSKQRQYRRRLDDLDRELRSIEVRFHGNQMRGVDFAAMMQFIDISPTKPGPDR